MPAATIGCMYASQKQRLSQPSAAWRYRASTCLYHSQDRNGARGGSRVHTPSLPIHRQHNALRRGAGATFLWHSTASQHFSRSALQAPLCISACAAGRVELGEAAGHRKLSRQLALLKPESPAALALVQPWLGSRRSLRRCTASRLQAPSSALAGLQTLGHCCTAVLLASA